MYFEKENDGNLENTDLNLYFFIFVPERTWICAYVSLQIRCVKLGKVVYLQLCVVNGSYKLLKKSFAIQVWFIIYHFIFCFQH